MKLDSQVCVLQLLGTFTPFPSYRNPTSLCIFAELDHPDAAVAAKEGRRLPVKPKSSNRMSEVFDSLHSGLWQDCHGQGTDVTCCRLACRLWLQGY